MKRQHIFILLVAVISVLPYLNTFGNEFVWDEKLFIQDNIKIRDTGNIPGFFLQTEDGLYRPLRTTLYAFTYSVWGENVFGYHLNSVMWHALSTVLIFLIISRLTSHKLVPFVSAIIFAVHPIHTERVTNMTGGFDLLGIFLTLLAFYLYIQYSERKKRLLIIASAASFIFALFSSEEALVFPLLVALYEIIFKKASLGADRKKLYPAAILAAILAAFLYFRLAVIQLGARFSEYPAGGFITTMLTMAKAALYYIYLSFVPYPLTLYREIETSTTIFSLMVLLSIAVMAAIIFFSVKYCKKYPLATFFTGWFFITLLPFSNILPLQGIMADRYLYVPSISSSFFLAYFFFKIPKRKAVSLALSLVLVTAFALITIDRNTEWKDNITLWEATSETSPKTSVVFSNLGFAYEQKGRFVDAENALAKAIKLDDSNEKAYYNLGIIYLRQKSYATAAEAFAIAIANKPDYAMAYDSLGLAYYYGSSESNDSSRLLTQAEASFQAAIEIEPGYYKPYNDLGIVRAQTGNFTNAIELFQASIQLNPWNHEAYYNLGIMHEFLGETEQAEENFLKAAQLQPESELYRKKIKN